MSDLYFIAPENRGALDQGKAILTDAEAQHLTRVMRKDVGDAVSLFDGSGREYRAQIVEVGKKRVELVILETIEDDREPDVAVTAIVALPKGDRQKWALEKLVELGVRRFVPLDCERSDVKTDEGVRERLERQVLEATKQCGRLRLMPVTPALSFSELPELLELLDAKTRDDAPALSERAQKLQTRFQGEPIFDEFKPGDEVLRVVTHPLSDGDFGQVGFQSLIASLDGRTPRGVLLMVGPAGGFSHAEVQRAVDGGWTPLELGRQVYRVETAALVASALFLHLS